MYRIWIKEYQYLLLAFAILAIAGAISGYWFIASIVVLGSYIVWMYRRLQKLEKWLSRGTKTSEVYDDDGFVGDIIRHLYHQRKVHNKRKKRTKEILRRLHRNISALPDATVLLNDQLEIEWSNAPAQYLLGINHRYDIGQRISNLIRHPDFLRYLITPDKKENLELDSPLDQNLTLQLKIVRFGHNQRLLTARNISDQKQLQEGLKKFVANASHELKTPLTTISGHLEMLENESGLSKSGMKSVEVAQKQSLRMRNLIQDLLLLSQVESYQLQPSEGDRLSIHDIMTNVMAAVNLSCSSPRVNCEIQHDLCLLGITSEIEGICINLIGNAVKYSKDEQTRIGIVWKSNKSDELIFKVSDEGIGINDTDLPHITERYFRGAQARAEGSTGSGLGLAIVQQAAIKHGARLEVRSVVDEGSEFKVIFPSYRRLEPLPEHHNKVVNILNAR
jgi:two-component system phosphate regulon sensor histidine kinase PhoR